MYSKIVLILLFNLIVLFMGCGDSRNSNETLAQEEPIELFPHEFKSLTKSSEGCEGSACAEVAIEYPYFESETEINERIAKIIQDILRQNILADVEQTKIPLLMDAFIAGYSDYKNHFPESETGWTITIQLKPRFKSKTFISLEISVDSYTGGAHPNSEIIYKNLSQNGKILDDLKYFVDSPEKLQALAEEKFRSRNEIPAGQSLSQAGFTFENDSFRLPENFGFTEQGMMFLFNPYEIAPYASGHFEIELAYAEINQLLKFETREMTL